MKKLLCSLLIIFILIGGSGCTMEKLTTQNVSDRMLDYINTKYPDDHFTFQNPSGGHIGSNVTKIIVQSENYPTEPVYVICTKVSNGEIFTDTYLHVKYEKQTYDYLRSVFSKDFGNDIYIYYSPSNTSAVTDFTNETTFEEYISNPNVYIDFTAIVHGTVADEDAAFESIKNLLSDCVVQGNIYFVDDTVVLSGDEGVTNAENILENSTYSKRLLLGKKNLDEYSIIEWTDGK